MLRSALFAAAVLVACSGSTVSSGSSSSSSASGGRACTEIGCNDGLTIDFSYRDAGAYLVEVDVDGVLTTCKATIPLPSGFSSACDRADVLLSLVGSALPPSQQSIGGVEVRSTTAKRVAIRVSRDGALLASNVYAPPPYVTSPGPNGPGCEPAQCTAATVSLADGATR